MRIHREGYTIISITIALLVIVNCILDLFFLNNWVMQAFLALASALVLLAICLFFRIPKRHFVNNQNGIICPADGKIVAVEEIEETEFFKEKMLQISIFMSPANVHINWVPVSGRIVYQKYHPGKYLVAWHPKSSQLNERTTTVIEHATAGQILVRQIAGFVARRIVCYSEMNKEVKQGDELGFIKFGSRVDVVFSLKIKPLVRTGEHVKGLNTLLANC